MEVSVAKVTSQGQITIPADIRRLLGIQPGGKVIFIQDGNRVMMANATSTHSTSVAAQPGRNERSRVSIQLVTTLKSNIIRGYRLEVIG